MTDYSAIQEYRPLKIFSYLAIGGLALMSLCKILIIVFGIGETIYPFSSPDFENKSVWYIFQSLFWLFQLPLYIFTIVFFLIWLHRAYNNLYPLKAPNIEYSATWAVGYWFIPILNLFRPYQVVREVWRESDPDFDPELNFLSNTVGSSAYIGAWWAFWIITNIVSNIAGRIIDAKGTTDETAILCFVIMSVLGLAAAILVIMVIQDITKRQELRFQKLGQTGLFSPPPPPNFG